MSETRQEAMQYSTLSQIAGHLVHFCEQSLGKASFAETTKESTATTTSMTCARRQHAENNAISTRRSSQSPTQADAYSARAVNT
mmetsp:Transcript_125114/g.325031  ORF Transcript_125114/g.325031 Transcript_125114/m.325031 type:complete len:84 (+) Transcript_125114:158-409(+)